MKINTPLVSFSQFIEYFESCHNLVLQAKLNHILMDIFYWIKFDNKKVLSEHTKMAVYLSKNNKPTDLYFFEKEVCKAYSCNARDLLESCCERRKDALNTL